MIEYQLVDHPAVHPQKCVCCNSAKGPLVDTFSEQWGERIYVCQLCVTRCARVIGIAKGEKMAELVNASALLAQKDAELVETQAAVTDLRGKLGEAKRQRVAYQDQLEAALNRERATNHLVNEIAGAVAQLQTVGEPVPA